MLSQHRGVGNTPRTFQLVSQTALSPHETANPADVTSNSRKHCDCPAPDIVDAPNAWHSFAGRLMLWSWPRGVVFPEGAQTIKPHHDQRDRVFCCFCSLVFRVIVPGLLQTVKPGQGIDE